MGSVAYCPVRSTDSAAKLDVELCTKGCVDSARKPQSSRVDWREQVSGWVLRQDCRCFGSVIARSRRHDVIRQVREGLPVVDCHLQRLSRE